MNSVLRQLRRLVLAGIALVALCPATAPAAAPDDGFLPAEQAYEYAVEARADALYVSFNIRDGYYLYRKRIAFTSDTAAITLGNVEFPKAQSHHDEYFGDQEIYRGAPTFRIPYTAAAARPAVVELHVKLQGCADAGLCYPPQNWLAHVRLPVAAPPGPSAAGSSLLGKLIGTPAPPTGGDASTQDFLPVEQAFRVALEADGDGRVRVHWQIQDGYYLYRARLKIDAEDAGVTLGTPGLPIGLPHHDDYFGDQQVYRGDLVVPVTYTGTTTGGALRLKVGYQGCADAGLCYPPQTQHLTSSGAAPAAGAAVSDQDRLAAVIRSGNLFVVIAMFWGFGLLLSFTPCVLPMVPILAGIIAGEGVRATPARAFLLSVAYVLGMSITYTAAGVAFAAAGSQAQAVFQQPWILLVFAGLFVALALAMFGLYELQLPSSLQTRFAAASNRVRGGKFVSTALMGALSSLVVTACVAPPLVATFAVIGQAGDIGRGALALAALSLGMGTPLLVVGASAGRLLPKAGPWMETVKAVFGVLFLGVAAWMLDRLVGPRTMMIVWAAVAASAAWVAWAVGLRGGRRGWLRTAVAALVALHTVALLAGGALGGTNPVLPLAGLGVFGAKVHDEALPFRAVHSAADLDRELASAHAAGQRTMLDFYADWCVSCKEMDAQTFRDPAVRAALAGYVLLRADVTANSPADQALLHRFGIFGPPTTALFAVDGVERRDYRLVGFKPADAFLSHLKAFESVP